MAGGNGWKHVVVTGTGVAQNLARSLTAAQLETLGLTYDPNQQGAPQSNEDAAGRAAYIAIAFQADGANAAAVYISENGSVSSSDWMFFIPAASAGVPSPPLILDHTPPVYLNDFWFVIANNEKLHVALKEG